MSFVTTARHGNLTAIADRAGVAVKKSAIRHWIPCIKAA